MFRLQDRAFIAVAQRVQLIGHQTELTFPVLLGRIAAVAVTSTEFFELVVQVAHGVSRSDKCLPIRRPWPAESACAATSAGHHSRST